MSDLKRMMRDAAAEPTEHTDVDRAWRRSRLHRAGFVALSLVAVIAVAGGAVIAASNIGDPDIGPALPRDIEPGGEGAIAFARAGSRGGIYVMKAADGNPVRVTSVKGDDQPAWSPDGSRIAFVRYQDGNQDIYVMNADGSNIVRFTNDGASGNPTWSPDGRRIAFQRETDGNADIYSMNANGTDVRRLTDDPLSEYTPAWSPHAIDIAFVGFSYGTSGPTPARLYLMNADGTRRRQLPAEDVAQPSWSPDGSKIVFVDSRGGSLYVINGDGTGLRQVVDLAGLTGGRANLTMSPSWSADGTRIVFATGSSATATHIYLVNEDGSGLMQLTDASVGDANPDWVIATGVVQESDRPVGDRSLELVRGIGPPPWQLIASGATSRRVCFELPAQETGRRRWCHTLSDRSVLTAFHTVPTGQTTHRLIFGVVGPAVEELLFRPGDHPESVVDLKRPRWLRRGHAIFLAATVGPGTTFSLRALDGEGSTIDRFNGP